jgi:hypothetical protein
VIYEDLDLRIQAGKKGLVVFAQRGTQTTSEDFHPPRIPSLDLEKLEERSPEEIRKVGAELFEALLPGKVRQLYDEGRGGAGGHAGKGLRIRIRIDTREPNLRKFAKFPWELMNDRTLNANSLPALDMRRPIVRVIESNAPAVAPPPGKLERVLLAWATPKDTKPLKVDTECKRVGDALFRNNLSPTVVKHATPQDLSSAIRDGKPQLVHFMGHGMLDSSAKEGAILLERKTRMRAALHASDLAEFFSGIEAPRLVILNCCLSGVSGRTRAMSAFSSVAAALVAAGLPAVIAMQSTIGDANAITFTERLYRRLLDGDPVEAAVADARVALRGADNHRLNWAVPVLYVRDTGTRVIVEKEPEIAHPQPEPGRREETQNETITAIFEQARDVFIGRNTLNGRRR